MRRQWLIGSLAVLLTGCGGGGLPPDTAPPAISNIAIEHTGNGVRARATVQDAETGVASVVVLATVGTNVQTIAMQAAGDHQYQAILPANTVRVRIRAQDRAGNTRETDDITAPPPTPPF
ncbi:MAG: hypothetical protein KatS3mg019_1216 [Fimbriimonadales bacterium]|nr:MAG: hypothetical protein KatS3mg019_1216 [Fimbriimonadales bacterium]